MAPAEAPGPEHHDVAAELERLGDRLAEAEQYLDLDGLRTRRAELEKQAAKPDLWDDPDRARAVTTELGRVSDDVDRLDGLRARLEDAAVLHELVGEGEQTGSPDASLVDELEQTVAGLERTLGDLELRSLF